MILKDLVRKYFWKTIGKQFFKLYPEELKNIIGYEETYSKLSTKNAKKSNIVIHMRFDDGKEFNPNGEPYYDVYGKDGTFDENCPNVNVETSWALELSSFSEWLGFKINDDLLKNMSEIDIICHCLYEMTFFGFTDKDIKGHVNEMNKAVKSIKDGTAGLTKLDLN